MKISLVFLIVSSSQLSCNVSSFIPKLFSGTKIRYKNELNMKFPSSKSTIKKEMIDIKENIGSGSYGVVHLCTINGKDEVMVGKRALTECEIKLRDTNSTESAQDRVKRCQHYLNVERLCFEKMQSSNESSPNIPKYMGLFKDNQGNEWLVFSLIERFDKKRPAITLGDALKKDWMDQHMDNNNDHHHLYVIQQELGLDEDATFDDTLDTVFASLLRALSDVHRNKIVHRDIKPGNLLLNSKSKSLCLIDFGSSEVLQSNKRNLFDFLRDDGDRVAVSPIYCAPETFIELDKAPFNFDSFSCALVFCQLLFNFLDEGTEAAFRQQLEECNFDLDAWLKEELTSTIRPAGLESSFTYLGDRPGLWKLLRDMLEKNPEKRATTLDSLKRFEFILQISKQGIFDNSIDESSFFESVVASYDECDIEDFQQTETMATPRPLHYVATFNKVDSLGLVLSEIDDDDDDNSDTLDSNHSWEQAVENAQPGEVFIKEIIPLGQADEIGIFEVGDRLRAIGEVPISNNGFEKAVDILQRQPKSVRTVTLHFDRKLIQRNKPIDETFDTIPLKVVEQGVWSTKGKRKSQEDTNILHEIYYNNHLNSILLAGVFDGHGGQQASKTIAQLLPFYIQEQLSENKEYSIQELNYIIESSWKNVCITYQEGCDLYGSCEAEYDSIHGVIMARTGSEDLTAGTTATMAIVANDKVIILNCGDSRAVIVRKPLQQQQQNPSESVVYFATQSHSPNSQQEMNRLKKGREAGFDYSIPECSFNKWTMKVGDYQYAVSRSLEGKFATSKGIICEPDVTTINLREISSQINTGILIIASDGVFDVIDNEEVGLETIKMRNLGFTASDAAKQLCSIALKKGSQDNISVIIVYLN